MIGDGSCETRAKVDLPTTDFRVLHERSQGKIIDLEAAREVDCRVIAELRADRLVDREKIANLETALVSARRIGAAIGIIMARSAITEDQAFALLRRASQHCNRKLRDVADDVLLTGALDDSLPVRVATQAVHAVQADATASRVSRR